jgi:CheY-like chemotaxis protein
MSMSATYSKAHKARILLVAADPQMRKLLKSVLTAGGYGKCFAVDGSHTVQAEAASSFDLVVLDLDLPYSSGHSIIGEIRRSSDVPVIAISGQAKEGPRRRARSWRRRLYCQAASLERAVGPHPLGAAAGLPRRGDLEDAGHGVDREDGLVRAHEP